MRKLLKLIHGEPVDNLIVDILHNNFKNSFVDDIMMNEVVFSDFCQTNDLKLCLLYRQAFELTLDHEVNINCTGLSALADYYTQGNRKNYYMAGIFYAINLIHEKDSPAGDKLIQLFRTGDKFLPRNKNFAKELGIKKDGETISQPYLDTFTIGDIPNFEANQELNDTEIKVLSEYQRINTIMILEADRIERLQKLFMLDDTLCEKDVNDTYRKLSLHLHPDKLSRKTSNTFVLHCAKWLYDMNADIKKALLLAFINQFKHQGLLNAIRTAKTELDEMHENKQGIDDQQLWQFTLAKENELKAMKSEIVSLNITDPYLSQSYHSQLAQLQDSVLSLKQNLCDKDALWAARFATLSTLLDEGRSKLNKKYSLFSISESGMSVCNDVYKKRDELADERQKLCKAKFCELMKALISFRNEAADDHLKCPTGATALFKIVGYTAKSNLILMFDDIIKENLDYFNEATNSDLKYENTFKPI